MRREVERRRVLEFVVWCSSDEVSAERSSILDKKRVGERRDKGRLGGAKEGRAACALGKAGEWKIIV